MAAKDTGINTAMESMGCAKWEIIEDILPYLDTYLLDIKHMNAEKHRAYTGKSNVLMLENAKKNRRERHDGADYPRAGCAGL